MGAPRSMRFLTWCFVGLIACAAVSAVTLEEVGAATDEDLVAAKDPVAMQKATVKKVGDGVLAKVAPFGGVSKGMAEAAKQKAKKGGAPAAAKHKKASHKKPIKK